MRQFLLYIFLLLVCSVNAEQFKITGKVVDAVDKEPLIFTVVQIKGTDRAVCADFDGNFSIEVEKGDTIKFSYVGYFTKEIEILNDSSLFIELDGDPNTVLDGPMVIEMQEDPKPLDGFIISYGGCK